MSRVRIAFGALVLAACSVSEPSPDDLLREEAARARELPFIHEPRVERRTREEFLRTSNGTSAALYERQAGELRDVWGRLGFFPPSFDARSAFVSSGELVGAFYSPDEKSLTLFEKPPSDTVVHELVHALQDQHFDLTAYDAAATSTDELLARRAVVEGDARLCQIRFRVTSAGQDPLTFIPSVVNHDRAVVDSSATLANGGLPAFFLAYASFAYPFGAAFVARQVIGPTGWSREKDDALFRAEAPKSTEAVLREGVDVDPVVEVGLARLPAEVADRFDVESVDRIGAWYMYLLLRDQVEVSFAKAWDGDQLVVLGPNDLSTSRGPRTPVAIVWTTAWETEADAATFVDALERLHGGVSDGAMTYRAADGEMFHLEQRGGRVNFVKGVIAAADMTTLAAAALDSGVATRMPIKRLHAGLDRR